MNEEEILTDKKQRVFSFLKDNPFIVVTIILLLLIAFGVYMRTLPMTNHGSTPGLWDITTNDWTLGPDLDPFLFLRYAKEMIAGTFATTDTMRNVPLGFDTSMELQMVPYMIVITYHLINIFGTYSVELAGVLMPVILFALTIIVFFFLVREIFKKDNVWKANIIASIASAILIILPSFMQRTIAGIPEKESVAFFFMFLAFYFFLRAWKSDKQFSAFILALLAGISTALMGLTWGGVTYIYITIALAVSGAFLFNKARAKETIIYGLWLISSVVVSVIFTNKYSFSWVVTSLDTGIASLVLAFLIINLIIPKSIVEKFKLPNNIIAIIITLILGAIASSILFGPTFIMDKAIDFNRIFFTPTIGRWVTTVAENRQPYFSEWGYEFGPIIGGIPIIFALFITGSIVLFMKMLHDIEKKDAINITYAYVLFLFTLIFSRYSPNSVLNGENAISRTIYYISGLILLVSLAYYYIKYHREHNPGFENIDFSYLFLFALFILCIFTARSAVRLILVLVPVAAVLVAFLVVETIDRYKSSQTSMQKTIFAIAAILIIFLTLYACYTTYEDSKVRSYNNVPYYYTYQWQIAMSWVRENTPVDSVFAHWWDYGYWVQSIGNRATVTDGGNAIIWWNYLMGRLVLTGDNEKEALDFLHSHKATHLLIDSSDISKYGAYSQIGSNKDYDRASQGPITFILDTRQIQETKTEIKRSYTMPYGSGVSIFPLEEDIITNDTALFVGGAGIMGIFVNYDTGVKAFTQPQAVFIQNNQQIVQQVRYLYIDKEFIDFGYGINATVYVIPRFYPNGQVDNQGAVIYISPRIMRGLFGQLYMLDDPFGNFNNFKLTYSEPDFILRQLIQGGAEVNEFSYFEGLRGPIKIWNITYDGDEQIKEEYLTKEVPSYITWKF